MTGIRTPRFPALLDACRDQTVWVRGLIKENPLRALLNDLPSNSSGKSRVFYAGLRAFWLLLWFRTSEQHSSRTACQTQLQCAPSSHHETKYTPGRKPEVDFVTPPTPYPCVTIMHIIVHTHSPWEPGLCLRLSHWLASPPGPAERKAPAGWPAARRPSAPPEGWQRCYPGRLSQPRNSVCMRTDRTNVATIGEYLWKKGVLSLNVLVCKTKGDFTPVAMVLVVLGGVNHGASFDTNLLEQVPHLLVDVLLRRQQGKDFWC